MSNSLRYHALLIQSQKQIVTAESCTGGGLASALTDFPGSSQYFLGGIVAYDNAVKTDLLDVDPTTLSQDGAVSEAVAVAMLDGVLSRFPQASLALSTTGIAGPDGGNAKKPVGSVFIGLADGDARYCRHFQFSGDRDAVRQSSITAALDWLVTHLSIGANA